MNTPKEKEKKSLFDKYSWAAEALFFALLIWGASFIQYASDKKDAQEHKDKSVVEVVDDREIPDGINPADLIPTWNTGKME